MTQITLRQFEVFIKVAELRSFSAASKSMHVSQPALTRVIHLLEEALGVRLFDRDTRKVELTSVGRELLSIAKRVMGDVDFACAEMHQYVDGLQGKVHIATLESVGAAILPYTITTFRESHPRVDFGLCETRVVAKWVNNGFYDFGIGVEPSKLDDLHYTHLYSDPIFVICRQDDPLAAEEKISWEIFKEKSIISMDRRSNFQSTVESVLRKLNLKVESHLECQNLVTTCDFVESGLGLSVVPGLALPKIVGKRLVARRLVNPEVTRSVGIITRPGHALSPAADKFLQVLMKEAPRLCAESLRTSIAKSNAVPDPSIPKSPRTKRRRRS